MKKLKIIGITVLVFAGIIAVLLNNRSKIQAKTNSEKIDSYPVIVSSVGKKEVERNLSLVGTMLFTPPGTSCPRIVEQCLRT